MMTDEPILRELLRAVNHLLEANQEATAGYAKTEMSMKRMLSNISHDLKTPLTVVVGYIETLHHTPDMPPEERRYMLDKVNRKALEVLSLINKFFDLAVLESADKNLPLSRIALNELCRQSILEFYETLSAQQFEVRIDIPDTPLYAFANEEALKRILNNLLSNAIRYGRDGRMLGLALRADKDSVYIDVTDKGKGIAEKDQNQVFERMYTLEDSRNKSYQGSGLGLTITKRLADKLQGSIQLRSRPFEETVFTVKLHRMIEGKRAE